MQGLLAGLPASRLQAVVGTALGERGAVLGAWKAIPLKGGASVLDAARSIYLLSGVARVGADEQPWSVILKVLARVTGTDDPAHIDYWKREGLLYASGLLQELPAGLRAPRCLGYDEPADGIAWLWLEHVPQHSAHAWPMSEWALTARLLGHFNGTYPAGRPLPDAPWLGGRRLRTWVGRHRPLVARIAAAPDNPDVRRWWPRPIVDAILHLWEERDAFCTALERLPQAFCHGDAIRRNLSIHRGAGDSVELVAIDWEHAGYYAAGEEVGQSLSVAGAFFDVEPEDLPALDEALFAAYLAGLGDAGWRGDARRVRLAYAAHGALRNAFNAVGAWVPDAARRAAARQTYGYTWEELAERRAALRPFLLERADEARRLMQTL